MYYMSLVHKDSIAGGYGFTIPELPGFVAHVETESFTQAVREAQDVLAAWLAAASDRGIEITAPGDGKEAEKALAEGEADTVAMLLAIMPAGRSVRVNISMDEETLALADEAAAMRKLSRSAFIVMAIKNVATGGAGAIPYLLDKLAFERLIYVFDSAIKESAIPSDTAERIWETTSSLCMWSPLQSSYHFAGEGKSIWRMSEKAAAREASERRHVVASAGRHYAGGALVPVSAAGPKKDEAGSGE